MLTKNKIDSQLATTNQWWAEVKPLGNNENQNIKSSNISITYKISIDVMGNQKSYPFDRSSFHIH